MAMLASLVFAGCSAGNGDGLDVAGRPLSEGGNVPLAASLESIQANVFNPFCVVCHAGANAPQGLRLDAINSFSNLVGVPSSEIGSLLRVSPGNPDGSYLVQKLEGSASVGGRMPLDAPALPQATIDFVRQWIQIGAPPTQGSGQSPPVVVSITPDNDSVLDTLPAQILVGFDQDIDASTINTSTFELHRSGGDGSFSEGNEVTIAATAVQLSTTNARLAEMDLSGANSVDDEYQVVLRGSGANFVLNLNALALDGEFSGNLPSGDGNEGGDFISTFTVQSLQPTLASIQENIFTPVCAACHSGPSGAGLPAGMDLSSETASFANLVNVASVQQPAILRVEPGDPDNSYLVQKLEGTAASGDRMPLGGPFLDPSTIGVVRQWILNGAIP